MRSRWTGIIRGGKLTAHTGPNPDIDPKGALELVELAQKIDGGVLGQGAEAVLVESLHPSDFVIEDLPYSHTPRIHFNRVATGYRTTAGRIIGVHGVRRKLNYFLRLFQRYDPEWKVVTSILRDAMLEDYTTPQSKDEREALNASVQEHAERLIVDLRRAGAYPDEVMSNQDDRLFMPIEYDPEIDESFVSPKFGLRQWVSFTGMDGEPAIGRIVGIEEDFSDNEYVWLYAVQTCYATYEYGNATAVLAHLHEHELQLTRPPEDKTHWERPKEDKPDDTTTVE